MDITTLSSIWTTHLPAHIRLWDAIQIRIDAYIREKIPIPAEEFPRSEALFRTYGTTLRGLQANFASPSRLPVPSSMTCP
jgi:hypothetical protein